MTDIPVTRTPSNVPGPFYVAMDQCITCMAPEGEAPDLMAFDAVAESCYFKRQPVTPDEIDRAIRAVGVACCGALGYAGNDPIVLARFRALGVSIPGR